jgi:hypothetical protein
MSQPQTHKWLDRTRSSDTTGHAQISKMNISTSNTLLVFILGTAVARVSALGRQCVTPVAQTQESVRAAGLKNHCSATVAVAECLV